MTKIDAKTVMNLRRETGAPMMDCKQALVECGGDVEKAKDSLRKKGMVAAAKASSREVNEGLLFSYVHHNDKLGVLVATGAALSLAPAPTVAGDGGNADALMPQRKICAAAKAGRWGSLSTPSADLVPPNTTTSSAKSSQIA